MSGVVRYLLQSTLGWISFSLLLIATAGYFKAMLMLNEANLITPQQPEGNLAEAFAATDILITSLVIGLIGIGFVIATVIRFRRQA